MTYWLIAEVTAAIVVLMIVFTGCALSVIKAAADAYTESHFGIIKRMIEAGLKPNQSDVNQLVSEVVN